MSPLIRERLFPVVICNGMGGVLGEKALIQHCNCWGEGDQHLN